MAKKRVHRPDGSRPVQQPSARSATPRPGAPAEPRDLRDWFEDASRPVLARMQTMPSFIIPVALGVMLFLGLTLSAAWAGILLILIALFLGWLTAVSWPAIGSRSKVLRIVIDLAVLGLGGLKLLGRI